MSHKRIEHQSPKNATNKKEKQVELSVKKKVSLRSENLVICKVGTFDEHYTIEGKIGEGSFGTVYKVTHKALKISRALKTIKKRINGQFSSFQEIQILKKLDHYNILKIYQFYEAQEFYYIITEIFEGKQLLDQITQNDKLSEEYASNIVQQIIRAVFYAHSLGIAHRDIKPQNILVRKQGDKLRVKVIDWGLGVFLGDKLSQRICGTPDYCAPEVLKGSHSISCDIWSIGVITYSMLTGEMPFSGNNTQQTIRIVKKGVLNTGSHMFRKLSIEAQKFIIGLINKNPEKRLTAEKALEHEWIVKMSKKQVQPIYLKETLERLRQFKVNNSFGLAVLSFINNHLSTDKEREKLEDIFKFLDKNGDGVLSIKELVDGYTKFYGNVLGKIIAEETFQKLDVNHNGSLQYSEFVAFGLKNEQEQDLAKMKEAFNLFDIDKNGKISLEQIILVLKGKLDEAMEEEVKEIIKEIDQNGDNEIDFQQFLKFVEKIHHNVSEKKGEKTQKQKQK